MALYKEKITSYGVKAGYWRVGTITVDRNMKQANFSLNLYLNNEADQFFETFAVTDLMISEDKADYIKYFETKEAYTDICNACYMYAKENIDYFKDAKDI